MIVVDDGSRRAAVAADVPTASFESELRVSSQVAAPAEPAVESSSRCVVELIRRAGGLMPRALIGGSFTPDATGLLRIELGVSEPPDEAPAVCQSLLWSTLIPGLTGEFAESALNGLLRRRLPSGAVVVDRAAFDPVESSPQAFELAGELLANVLYAMTVGSSVEAATRTAVMSWP